MAIKPLKRLRDPEPAAHSGVCNLYSMTRAQDAMREVFGVKRDCAENLPSLPGIFSDQLAPESPK